MSTAVCEIGSGPVVSRLTPGNLRKSFLLRAHPVYGMFRITVIPLGYYDRGAGGFMAGRGAFITEARVVCEPYPSPVRKSQYYAIQSKAGWGGTGDVDTQSGQIRIDDPQPVSAKRALSTYDQLFWTLQEAIDYANGEQNTALGRDTKSILVSRRNGMLTLKLGEAVIGQFPEIRTQK